MINTDHRSPIEFTASTSCSWTTWTLVDRVRCERGVTFHNFEKSDYANVLISTRLEKICAKSDHDVKELFRYLYPKCWRLGKNCAKFQADGLYKTALTVAQMDHHQLHQWHICFLSTQLQQLAKKNAVDLLPAAGLSSRTIRYHFCLRHARKSSIIH